ncbi:MAG: efflux RND transporter periplasmic adaptor subunit [Planctomycetes bacterium]|nr:efflux RND transporter periplasmic adaptor subunit [Planctomycetota bacterium]
MSFLRSVLRVLLPLLVLALGVAGAWALVQAREKKPVDAVPPAHPLIEVAIAQRATWSPTIRAQGTVRPAVESELVSEVAGRVIELAPGLRAGARFERGEPLARIDPRDYELAVVEAEAAVAQAQLALEVEKAESEAAQQAWQSLGEATPPTPLALREPQLAEARARVAASKARLEGARRDLERTTLTAPYDGITFEKSVDLGQFVARGARLAHLLGRDAVEVRIPIQPDELALLGLAGAPDAGRDRTVELRAHDGIDSARWTGRIVRREDWLDPRSRTIALVVRVEDPYPATGDRTPMFVNLFVQAELRGTELADVVVLPRAALRNDQRVWVVDGEQRLRPRAVDIVRKERDTIVVRGGLDASERVCTTPLDAVTDGMHVRVVDPATRSSSR